MIDSTNQLFYLDWDLLDELRFSSKLNDAGMDIELNKKRHSITELWSIVFTYNGWITWCLVNALIHIVWVLCIFIFQLYQVCVDVNC